MILLDQESGGAAFSPFSPLQRLRQGPTFQPCRGGTNRFGIAILDMCLGLSTYVEPPIMWTHKSLKKLEIFATPGCLAETQ